MLYSFASLPDDIQEGLIKEKACQDILNFLPENSIDEGAAVRGQERWQVSSETSRSRAKARKVIRDKFYTFWGSSRLSKTAAREEYCRLFNSQSLEFEPWVYKNIKKISPRTLKNWDKAIRTHGIAGLLDKTNTNKGQWLNMPPEIKTLIRAYTHRYPHIRTARLHEIIVKTYREKLDQLPSMSTIYRYRKAWEKENIQLNALEKDPRVEKNNYLASFLDKDENVSYFCEVWEMDSTPADVMTADGKRCSIVGCIDIFSRRGKLLVSPTSKSTAIAACMRKSMMDWGVASNIRMDNGADYQSDHVTLILSSLQIAQLSCRPYHGEDKPFIERFFRTFSHYVCELHYGYTGHSVAERQAIRERKIWGEKILKTSEVVECPLTLEELQDLCDRWTSLYDNTVHSSINETPLRKANSSKKQPRKITDERSLDLLLAPVTSRIVGKKAIRIDNARYVSEELVEHVGKRVQPRLDPSDAGTIYVFEQTKDSFRFLCKAHDAALKGIDREKYFEAKKQHGKNLRAQYRALDELGKSYEDPLTVLLPTGEIKPPPEKVVKFQAKADGPAFKEAEKALADTQPEKELGLAQKAGIDLSRSDQAEGSYKVLPLNTERPQPEPKERPVFDKPIDAYDYLCKIEEEYGGLSQEDQEYREYLLETCGSQIEPFLKLREENARVSMERACS